MKTRFLLRAFALITIATLGFATLATAQLQVIPGGTAPYNPPTNLIQNVLIGAGVTLVGTPTFAGTNAQVGYFDGSATNIGLASGIIMSTGPAVRAIGPNNTTGNAFLGGDDVGSLATDANLSAIAGGSTIEDVCKFDFDFIPQADTLRFRYVFASEEYPNFPCTGVNDVFGFFISGQRPASLGGGVYNNFNLATVPNTNLTVSIDNINGPGSGCGPAGVNPQYYINNPANSVTIQYDGFTTVLTAQVVVVPCTQYHIKLAISDVTDAIYDTAIFLEAESFGTGLVATTLGTPQPDGTISEGGTPAQVCFNIPRVRTVPTTINYTLGGTATPGVDYTITPATVVVPAGQLSACVTFTPLTDAGQETLETIRVFVQASACRRDTFDIDLIDPLIVAPVIPDVSLCAGAAGVALDASQAIIIPAPKVFTQTTGGALTCACPGGANPGPPLVSPLVVSGVAGQFNTTNAQMRVCVNIAHTNIGDVDMYLINPCGNVLELSTDNGGGGDNMTNTCFIVGSPAPSIQTGAAPFTGNFIPEDPWSLFNGCPFNGTWRLQVGDDSNPTNGTLNSWSITFPPSYAINYAWSPGTGLSCTNCATPTANPGVNTTYTVTVSDAYGTSVTDNVAISYVSTIPAPAVTAGPTTPSSVSFDWNPLGGVTGYEVSLDNGLTWLANGLSTTYNINGLTQGQTRCISVRGVGSCLADTARWCATANVSCLLSATLAAPPIPCTGGTTAITATAVDNLTAVTYQLGTGAAQASNTFSGLVAGTYTVRVRETGNTTCSTTASITIANPTTVSVSIVPASIDSVSCFGGSDGKATAVATGGNNANYNYVWCNASAGANVLNLAAGTCTVTATDANGCSATATVTIGQPVVLQASIVSSTPLTCNGGLPSGTATATAIGGTRNYRYLWDGGAITAAVTGLSLGVHTVTVTDKNGCISTATVNITQPTAVVATAAALTPTRCFGSSDGSAQGSASGGTPPYTFIWDLGTTNPSLVLNVGTHTVTATDANGCMGSSTVTIVQPTQITATAAQTPTGEVSCFGGSDGDATANGAGGTPPYTYAWSTGGPVQSPNNVFSAGPHTVTVTDANGCATTANVTITQPTQITATASTTSNATCFNFTNGVGSVIVGGATPPYTYAWSSQSINNPANNLGAGTHTVTVSDVRGCSITSTVVVTAPTQVVATTSLVNNISCNGSNDGSLNGIGAGGTPPYTYVWDNAQQFTPATSLFPGLHFVTVTDAAGCTGTASGTITQPAALQVPTSLLQTVSCPGLNDGSISANPTGGTAPYTFNWSSGEITNPAVLLFAGPVSVTVTDANSCTFVATATMTEPNALSIVMGIPTSVSCFGGNNGSVTVTVTGGTPTYTYAWNINPNSGNNPINLPFGTHTVTVTDSRNCVGTAEVIITEPTQLIANAVETTPVTCNGLSNGVISTTAIGGVPPYTYVWSGGLGVQPNPSTCPAGLYTVTVTDANNCSVTTTVTVTEPILLSVTAVADNPTTCFGAFNGGATATGAGGVGSYTYQWDNGSPNASATTLSAGPHSVTVTDANTCTASTTVTIIQPDVLAATATQNTAVVCNGQSNGSAATVVTGGTAPYIYIWNGGSALPNPADLPAGPHTVTVTDANACTTTATVTISQPAILTATAVQTQAISCNGLTDGHASISAGGGIQPYTYLWSNGETLQSPTNFDDGTITCIVTDFNGCTTIATTTIFEPPLLTATTTSTSNSCFEGADGTATVFGLGGISPYTYEWNVSQIIDPTAVGLAFGTYTVTISDVNSCTATATVQVGQPTEIVPTIVPTNIQCFGNLSGVATVTATGGTTTSPYTYLWSNGQVSGTASGLARGYYSVIVTDANGCTATEDITLTEPPILALSVNATNILCNGAQNGAVAVSPQGGTGAGTYIYQWNTLNNDITSQVNNLASGVYVVTVTDGNGCTKTAEVQVQEPSIVVLSTAVTDISCNGAATGQIDVSVAGGTGAYTYLWSDGAAQQTPTATGLTVGVYTVTVTDANNCSRTISANVSEPTAMTLQMLQTPTKCYMSADGSATVFVGGASGSYAYNWSTSPGQNGSTANNLPSGIYTVTVTDIALCTQTASVFVDQPALLEVTMTMTPVRCNGETTGTATANVTGGTSGNNGGYNYSWTSAAAAQNTPTATNLPFGTYTVAVADANGCTASGSVEITTLTSVDLTTQTTPVKCFGETNGTASVAAVGGEGTYTYLWNTPAAGTDSLAIGLSSGTYIVTVTDGNNCTATASVEVVQPSVLLLSNVTTTPVSCKGGNDGTAVVSPQGGNGDYTYIWVTQPDPQLTETATNLAAGNYNVSVTDIKGCSTNTIVTITEPLSAITATATFTEPTCFGGTNGTATVFPDGGTITATAGYTYLWNGGQNTQTARNFSTGIYTVIVTDIKGCTATARVELLQPSPITLQYVNTVGSSCNNGRDGSSTAFGSGGSPNYTYMWGTVPQRAGDFMDGLFGGQTYVVTATDVKGCTGTGTVSIPNPAPMTLVATTTPANCFGVGSGTATVRPTGGTPAYNYLWSNNNINATATNLTAGVYAVTVTDLKGCSATSSVTVIQGSTLSLRSTAKPVRCFGEANGIATAIPTGGAPNYSYAWSNNATINAPSQNNLPQGTYTVTITDASTCTVATSIEITQPAEMIANATPTNLRCYGSIDGQLHIDISGGSAPYKYTFNTGMTPSTNATLIGTRAGVYKVTVRDVNGCTATTTATIDEPQQLKVDVGNDQRIEFQIGSAKLVATCNDLTALFSWSATPNDAGLTALNNTNSVITVSPLSDTYYYVTATDQKGCTASDRVQVTVNATRRVFVATAFTPDANGVNDMMFVQGGVGTVKVRSFQIFNRWGEQVFASANTDPNVPAYGWDGRYKGELVDPAVYVWTAEVEFADGQVLIYKGDFSVLK
jgi:large repetitive protein